MNTDNSRGDHADSFTTRMAGSLAFHSTLVAAFVGCGDNTAAIRAVQDAVQTSGSFSQESNPDKFTTDEDPAPRDFVPKNPGRRNPFEMDVQQPAPSEAAAVQGIGSASQIVVMGFADVGTSRVMLQIGEQTKILKQGDKFRGVEIVSIAPPNVELKMDNLSWTATMFDERAK